MSGGEKPSLRHERRLWWCLFGLLATALVAWTMEVPLLAGTDEPSHAIRAAAVVRGQLVGDDILYVEGMPIATFVEVPEAYRNSDRAVCFELNPRRSAACAPAFEGDHRLIRATTNQYRAPALYYGIVGSPTLLLPSAAGVYAMRLFNAIVCAGFLASAFLSALALRRRGLVVVGILVAITPEVLYLGATVNSNGMEIAAAICMWSTLLAIVRGAGEPSQRLVSRAGVALVILVLIRGLSPMFASFILLSIACLGQREWLAQLGARRDVRRWLIASAVSAAAATAWIAYIQLDIPLDRTGSGLVDAIGKTPTFFQQAIGVFNFHSLGPLRAEEIPLPAVVYVCWAVATVALLAVALATASRRDMLVLLAVLGTAVVLPVLVYGLNVPPIGVPWVGRHGLPLLAGVPIIAAAITNASGRPSPDLAKLASRVGFAVLCVVLAAQVIAFAATLRLWAVGSAGSQNPIDYLFSPDWSPPVPGLALFLLFAGSMCALVAFAGNALRTDRAPDFASS